MPREKNMSRDNMSMPKKQAKKPTKPQKQKPKQPPKQQPTQSSSSSSAAAAVPSLPVPLQQRLLDTFNAAFSPVLASPSFPALLQEVKAALYARDFDAAFANAAPDSLDAYAARWSPTRALGYAGVLLAVGEYLEEAHLIRDGVGSDDGAAAEPEAEEEPAADGKPETQAQAQKTIKMLSIGGGAAEIASFGAYLSTHAPSLAGHVHLLDSAPWGPVVTKLQHALATPPPLSKYANAAARASNAALLPASHLTATFTQRDVLSMSRDELGSALGNDVLLATLLFTLNELYTSAGIGKTTAFLLNLSATIPSGSLLLVVDSPGSYSEAAVGKESKKYPMQWLLDHTLRKDEKPVEGCLWEKVESHDSVWFRLAEGLRYPISLENMRYQMHLYRATRP
ncbi:25S rRNA (uridine(2843)-N(3))-methyltransferase [Colletotrichum viniferum]|nr:25S rRNA (uridine(2843)-N(3))-methyltransferase [Colletotrichum viniferum]